MLLAKFAGGAVKPSNVFKLWTMGPTRFMHSLQETFLISQGVFYLPAISCTSLRRRVMASLLNFLGALFSNFSRCNRETHIKFCMCHVLFSNFASPSARTSCFLVNSSQYD